MFGVKENNFLGKGIILNSNLLVSEENIKDFFLILNQTIITLIRIYLSIESQETDRLNDFGYKSNDTGVMIGTNYEYLEDLYFSPKFQFSESLTTSSSLLVCSKARGKLF